jgi:nitronate monooxygenase
MTRFTELVGCELPLQGAALGGMGTGAAAAITEAGALGTVPIGGLTVEQVETLLASQPRPLAVNTTRLFDERREQLELASQSARVVEFFWIEPRRDAVELVHAGGALASWQCGSLDEARAAVDAGCDYVTLQGIEAGGHVRGETPVRELVSDGARELPVPIVAAGGIGTAEDVAELLALGAAAVRVGTRFVAAQETRAHPEYVSALIAATSEDTELTELFSVGWPNAPHRVLRSCMRAAEQFEGDVTGRRGTMEIARFASVPPNADTEGEIAAMALYAGLGVGAVTRVESAGEIVHALCANVG